MTWCWLISMSILRDGVWEKHIESIHLDEGDALRRVHELVINEADILETITSRKGVPHNWEWWNANRDVVVAADRVEIGVPMYYPVSVSEDNAEAVSSDGDMSSDVDVADVVDAPM